MAGPRSEYYFTTKGKIIEVRDDNWECEVVGDWSFEKDFLKIDNKTLRSVYWLSDSKMENDKFGQSIIFSISKIDSSNSRLKEEETYVLQFFGTADPRISKDR